MVLATKDRIRHLHEIHKDLKIMIALVGEHAKRRYDNGVKIQPTFQIGDKVLLRHDNIPTMAPSRKLASKFLEPLSIFDVVYRLKLPPTLQIHDVFHVSLLERYQLDTIIG